MAKYRFVPDSRASDLVIALVMAHSVGAATWWVTGQPASYLAVNSALCIGLTAAVWLLLPADAPGPGIGSANRVTLFRAALAVPVLGLAPLFGTLASAGYWWVIALSTTALVLDGVDGRVARRTATETRFGARFDMEVDAALILGLSALVWQSGKVGAWVLLIGGMRYLFVAAGGVWPALAAELPPSRRRRVVCVAQGVVLLVALGPFVPPWAAVVVAGGGLASLAYSFGADVRWALAAPRGQALEDAPASGAPTASKTSIR